uniref:Uncharacterized protein n=1 Tax=Magallana gigas TaxID=29159 RepID=K1RT62_MAGGI
MENITFHPFPTQKKDPKGRKASSSETYTSFSGMDIDFQTPPVVNEEVVIAASDSVSEIADCTDNNGAVVGHEATWPTSTGSCDKNKCWHGTLKKFVLTYSCPSLKSGENPDTDNCFETSNSALSFPDCCPTLTCNSSAPLTTLAPTACYDLGSDFACSVWSNMTAGCVSGTDGYGDRIYNYTNLIAPKFCNICCCVHYVLAFEATRREARVNKGERENAKQIERIHLMQSQRLLVYKDNIKPGRNQFQCVGYFGLQCTTKCSPGFYGFGCRLNCSCVPCNNINGSCDVGDKDVNDMEMSYDDENIRENVLNLRLKLRHFWKVTSSSRGDSTTRY